MIWQTETTGKNRAADAQRNAATDALAKVTD
jgi:hypothetical protein